MVSQRIDRGLRRLSCSLEQALAEGLTSEEGFSRCGAERRHPDRAERDARLSATDAVPFKRDDRGGGDGRVVVRRPWQELEERRTAPRGRRRHRDRCHELAGLEGGLVVVT